MNVSFVIAVRHVFAVFGNVRNPESEIRNPEFATLFFSLFVENHFAFTIFFVSLFFNHQILSRKSQKSP